jgi:MFS transporter, SP family, arabinose:H+ symporter
MKSSQWLVSIASALGGLMFGFDVGIIGGALPFLESHFALTAISKGWVTSSLLLGAILGAAFAGKMADRLGRKRSLHYIALIFGVTSIMAGLVESVTALALWRFFGGVSVGAVSVISPMYLSECAPAKSRGKMVSLYQLAITLGIMLSFFINYILHDIGDWNWRWMFIIGVFPSLIFWVCLFFIPESPRWLILKNKNVEALSALNFISGSNSVQAEFDKIRASVHTSEQTQTTSLGQNKSVLFIGICLALLIQFSGINTVMDYAPSMLKSAGWQIDGALFSTFGIGMINVVFTIIGVLIIDKVGRRNLYLVGSLGMSLALMVMTFLQYTDQFNGAAVLILLMIFVAFFAACIGPAFWTLVSEIYPNAIRAQAMSITALVNWFANFLVVFLYPQLVEFLGAPHTFAMLLSMSFLQLVFAWNYLKETKGQSLEEINVGGH